jgi:folate-dependent phosphoribosylglycinamide formyltransferase PurN
LSEANGIAPTRGSAAEASNLPQPRLKVLFLTEDEPFHMAAAFSKVLAAKPDWLDVAGVVMLDFGPAQGRGSKMQLFRSIAAHGLGDATRATIRFVTHKLRPSRRLAAVLRRAGVGVYRLAEINGGLTELIERAAPDAVVTFGLNRIVPTSIWNRGRVRWLNVHLGLLPRHRGASPVFWALHDGDRETGLSVHLFAERVDGGAVLAQRSHAVERRNLVSEVGSLRMLAVEAMFEALDRVRRADIPPPPSGPLDPVEPLPTHEDVRRFRQRGNRLI